MQLLRDERLPNPEAEILQRLHSHSPIEVGQLNVGIIRALYSKGLVWLDVPIRPEDRCKIPPLHNFVMNKDCGDDAFEQILYQILVSHDERADVKAPTPDPPTTEH